MFWEERLLCEGIKLMTKEVWFIFRLVWVVGLVVTWGWFSVRVGVGRVHVVWCGLVGVGRVRGGCWLAKLLLAQTSLAIRWPSILHFFSPTKISATSLTIIFVSADWFGVVLAFECAIEFVVDNSLSLISATNYMHFWIAKWFSFNALSPFSLMFIPSCVFMSSMDGVVELEFQDSWRYLTPMMLPEFIFSSLKWVPYSLLSSSFLCFHVCHGWSGWAWVSWFTKIPHSNDASRIYIFFSQVRTL